MGNRERSRFKEWCFVDLQHQPDKNERANERKKKGLDL